MALWYLANLAGALFIASLIYSQYALLRVLIDRRRNGGSGWVIPGWQLAKEARLSEQGRKFRSRYARSIVVCLVSFVVCVVALDLAN